SPPPLSTLFPYTTLFRSVDFNDETFASIDSPRTAIVDALPGRREHSSFSPARLYTTSIQDSTFNLMSIGSRRLFFSWGGWDFIRSEEHTSELQSLAYLVC